MADFDETNNTRALGLMQCSCVRLCLSICLSLCLPVCLSVCVWRESGGLGLEVVKGWGGCWWLVGGGGVRAC